MSLMRLPYYHVDAFTSQLFHGNPAGVCLLETWLPNSTLLSIAAENNLAETAFLVRNEDFFELRWFTPEVEIDLCGHATLASAFVLFSEKLASGDAVRFKSQSGWLATSRRNELLELDFPSRPPLPCMPPEKLIDGLGRLPSEVLKSRDYVAVFDSPTDVAKLAPDFQTLAQLDSLGIIVTAKGTDCDFVSRFFAPAAGVPEDPVTGSAHCSLIPFWAGRLGKNELFARQISKRGGELHCRLLGERVGIAGQARLYSKGEIQIPT